MPRSRNIKPGFFGSEQLGQCSCQARLLFAAFWTLADRSGRLEERPMKLRAYAFPFDPFSVAEVESWIDELERENLIERWRADGKNIISVTNFLKHQNPHPNEKKSEFADKPVTSKLQASEHSVTFPEQERKKVSDNSMTFFDSSREKISLYPSSFIPLTDSLFPHSASEGPPPAAKPPASRFTKPTSAEVTGYAAGIGFALDGERFCDYYESKGWLVGKSPMKSWRAAVRTWARGSDGTQSAKLSAKVAARNAACKSCFGAGYQTAMSEEDFRAMLNDDTLSEAEMQTKVEQSRVPCPECGGKPNAL